MGPATLHLSSSLLQLRGSSAVPAPHHHPTTRNILLWNGEIFGGLDIPPGQNDGSLLLEALSTASTAADDTNSEGEEEEESPVIEVLSRIRGPWAVVFWQASTSTLWFGRDVMGRRSLLVQLPTPESGGQLILASVPPLDSGISMESLKELPPGLYSLHLGGKLQTQSDGGTQIHTHLVKHKWKDADLRAIHAWERALIPPDAPAGSEEQAASAAATVLTALQEAVNVRCCIEHCDSFPPLLRQHKESKSDTDLEGSDIERAPLPLLDTFDLHDVRVQSRSLSPARVLILFSGGVDSTLLAALAHHALPEGVPIDLASVCFDSGNSPDRLAALDAVEELKVLAPTRPWRLIAINKSLEDIDAVKPRLLRLLGPADTIMDLNIGAALWLAAQGQGTLLVCENGVGKGAGDIDSTGDQQPWVGQQYRSAARVVFLGHGADELFGGYSRHRTRFRNAGWEGLSDELARDVKRLWVRNLGRDDRLVADCSREARHPFLDEAVMKLALTMSLPHLVNMELPPGKGDKRVLRDALRLLGAPRAAERVKRAIQFGSRLAKRTNEREFGGTRQANARSAGRVRLKDVISAT